MGKKHLSFVGGVGGADVVSSSFAIEFDSLVHVLSMLLCQHNLCIFKANFRYSDWVESSQSSRDSGSEGLEAYPLVISYSSLLNVAQSK